MSSTINNLKLKKSTGYDNITSETIYRCKDAIAPILEHIFNQIILTSNYPDCLKISKVVPIPKVPNAAIVNNYRPISLLSTIDKIFEKLIHEKLLAYFDNNNFLYKHQYGFKKGCGTEDAVINVINYVCDGIDRGSCGVAGLFLDFTKAFDLVDHGIMIQKLKYYGVVDGELKLFENFLKNRKQFVQLKNVKSDSLDVDSGVPQGSCLGPLLFSIYINDLCKLNLSGKLFMFADDVCLFYPYKFDLVLKTYMERDVALIFEYARLNKLILNANKTKMIRFRPRSYLPNNNFSISVDGNEIFETHEVKYLGVTLQSNLAWNSHIKEVKRKIAPAIGILFKMRNKLNLKTKLLIYQALIQSHLNYMVTLYGYKNTTELKSLQVLQNKSLKLIHNLAVLYPTLTLYEDVCKPIMPICAQYKYKLLMYMFKSINRIGYHTIDFVQNQRIFSTRSQSNLYTPRCRLETTKQRIEYAGSLEYNSLPTRLKTINTISTFKRELKEFLFGRFEMLLRR